MKDVFASTRSNTPIQFMSIPTPSRVKQYFCNFDLFDCFDPPRCGNCGFTMFMGFLFKYRHCPDSNVDAFRHRTRLFMEDKGAEYFRAVLDPSRFDVCLDSIWNPSLDPMIYNQASKEKVLNRDHWCSTTILEVLGHMYGLKGVVLFMVQNGSIPCVTISNLRPKHNDQGLMKCHVVVDISPNRDYIMDICPMMNQDSVQDILYGVFTGAHFQLLFPKPFTSDLCRRYSRQIQRVASRSRDNSNETDPTFRQFTFESLQSKVQVAESKSQAKKHKLYEDEEEAEDNNDEGEVELEPVKVCKVCLENPIDTVLLHCGHAVMCSTCSETPNLIKMNLMCPVCRAEIVECKRIFFA